MRKSTILGFLVFLTLSCSDNNLSSEVARLKSENDSLQKIMAGIEKKYVFDSISVRDIPSFKNQYTVDSEIQGEIVFVGYNFNDESRVIMFDSVNYDNGRTLFNPDTLKNVKGGYRYKKILTSDMNTLRADLKTENEYGKEFNVVYHTAIKAEKN